MTYIIDTPERAPKTSTAAVCDSCLMTRLGANGLTNLSSTATVGRCDSCLKQSVVHRLR